MTAVSTRLVRTGGYLIESAATGELIREDTAKPNTYGHVVRDGLRVRWEITGGKYGPTLAAGRAWTKNGAWVRAIAAAHRRTKRGAK